MTTKVFTYGSLKRGYYNNCLLEDSTFVNEGATAGAEFTMYDGGFPYVTTGGDGIIYGEVWEVDEHTLRRLDQLEGVPHHYIRHTTNIALEDGTMETCLMYVASEDTQEYLNEQTPMEASADGLLVWA